MYLTFPTACIPIPLLCRARLEWASPEPEPQFRGDYRTSMFHRLPLGTFFLHPFGSIVLHPERLVFELITHNIYCSLTKAALEGLDPIGQGGVTVALATGLDTTYETIFAVTFAGSTVDGDVEALQVKRLMCSPLNFVDRQTASSSSRTVVVHYPADLAAPDLSCLVFWRHLQPRQTRRIIWLISYKCWER